eukprot:gnl/TRDRNA2_/TRDRNA2_174603_c1_seq105.p1 gnl/TRDRNA2_/TRDRNA2_174603_c1~~gnl/TRDRNA2_/TRDRNA2_174603_c1_seq105.p1  ORF type:complete len:163 (+),score=45.48 gnl/TRDRNA2_/TRDRNA2_174603_c1_seq105:81-569(+)
MQTSRVVCILLVALAVQASRLRNAPDVATRVAEEASQNLQIHDVFAAQEVKSVDSEKKVKADKELKSLVQKNGKGIKDPCASITCGELACPAGFLVEEKEGHCCPYCVNPNIKVEDLVKGATGTNGGAPSTFCDDVWCFPTMCTGTETSPTTTNGLCCKQCS